MKTCIQTLLLCVAVVSLHADDITTTEGKKYLNVTISRTEPDGLVVMTDAGIEKIPFGVLPKELQTKYGYDAQKAAQFAAAVDAAAAQRQAAAHLAEAAQERDKQADNARQAKEQATAAKAATASRIHGRVVQVTKDGLLVESQADLGVADSAASVGGGGGVYVAPDPHGRGRPREVYGSFLVVGHPKRAGLADDARIDVDAYEDGTYSYVTVVGAQRTVKKYVVVKAFE